MAQIFHHSTNVLSRVSLLGALGAPVLLIIGASTVSRSAYNTKVGVPLDQPIPFSHQHHAIELGIDCRYCHGIVEKSANAGVPPTHTCMSCHSQIWTNSPLLEPVRASYRENIPVVWNRVNKVPEFVYFNHSIHINRGLNCNICHGPVQKMALTYKGNSFTMKWCLECHRNPEKYLYTSKPKEGAQGRQLTPREQVFDLYKKYQGNKKDLTQREEMLMEGTAELYTPTKEEHQEAEALITKYGVKKAQLADCWICHR